MFSILVNGIIINWSLRVLWLIFVCLLCFCVDENEECYDFSVVLGE